MGEGPIEDSRLPEEVRIIRHNLRNIQHQQGLTGELLTDVMKESSETRAVAQLAKTESATAIAGVMAINQELYGHPDRKDDHGALGRIEGALKRQSAQNWAILMSMVALIGVLLAAIFQLK